MHASWNAALRNSPDKLAVMVFIMCFGGLMFAPATLLVPFPSIEVWYFIAGSVSVHLFYQIMLTKMHEHNPLTFAYPIARGLGPLLVTIASFFLFTNSLDLKEVGFISILVAGIFLTSRKEESQTNTNIVYPILTGFGIATYTIVDGIAVKHSEEALSFIVWSGLMAAPPLYVYALKTRGGSIMADALRAWKVGLPTALIAQIGYVIALFAYRFGNLGEISALRESSILFAAAIGYVWLKEPLSKRKLFALVMIFTGTAALALT